MNRDRIDEIRKQTDIVEVISRYVSLDKSGSSYKGLCPFHEDSDPSLSVDPQRNLWYCFGCGAGGDVFQFLMQIENLAFPDAARELAREAGIPVDTEDNGSETASLRQLTEEVGSYFHENLKREGVGRQARSYLQSRGYGSEVIDKFQLGYSLDSWRAMTNKFRSNYSVEVLQKAGLINSSDDGRYYDRFRNRLMFPINSPNGQVIAFGGRLLEEDDKGPKYLNSPNTPLFHKGCTLFGLDVARTEMATTDRAVLVEGYTDVLAPQSEGLTNVVASLGTALTEQQADLLRRFSDEVIIAYDRDQAGDRATLKGMKLLRNKGLAVKVATLPPDKDPADIVEDKGLQAFRGFLEEAIPFYQFYLQLLERRYNLNSVQGREQALHDSQKFIKNINSPVLKDELIRDLKDLLGTSEEQLKNTLSRSGSSASASAGMDSESLQVQQTQEDLSPGEWVLYFLLEDLIDMESIEEAELLEGLDEASRYLIRKVDQARSQGKELESVMSSLEDKYRETLTRVAVADLPFDEPDMAQASSQVVQKIRSKVIDKKRRKLQRQLKLRESNGATKSELEEIQNELLKLQRQRMHQGDNERRE